MRKNAALIAGAWLAACAAPKASVPARPEPAANFAVAVDEVVERPEDEGTAYAKIFIDGAAAGETPTGPRSREKTWQGRLPVGNRLVRVEYWILPGLGAWEKLAGNLQPHERFVRVEEGVKSTVTVKFSEQGKTHDWRVTRAALPILSHGS